MIPVKKLICAALALVLGFGLTACGAGSGEKWDKVPASDFEYKYNAELGGVEITKYTGTLIKVRIPDKIEGEPVVSINGVFEDSGIISVYIPDSVTSIDGFAFSGCTGLTSVTISNSVTSIGGFAFKGCTGLTSVTIPNSVTRIGEAAFVGCTGLTSVTIPDSVTSISEFAFSNCTGLNVNYRGVTYAVHLYETTYGMITSLPQEFYNTVNGK